MIGDNLVMKNTYGFARDPLDVGLLTELVGEEDRALFGVADQVAKLAVMPAYLTKLI